MPMQKRSASHGYHGPSSNAISKAGLTRCRWETVRVHLDRGRLRVIAGLCVMAALLAALGAHTTERPRPRTTESPRIRAILQAEGCACVGFISHGQVTSVSATWTVPTIAPKSHGRASTWIGAQASSTPGHPGRFIQIGDLEERVVPPGLMTSGLPIGTNPPHYRLFWSDTDRHFHPVDGQPVRAGDVVHASMAFAHGQWRLRFVDARSRLDFSFSTPEEAGPMDQADWLQEDPRRTSDYRLAPYPEISPVSFTHLSVNDHIPVLPSMEGEVIGPFNSKLQYSNSDLRNDAFTVSAQKL